MVYCCENIRKAHKLIVSAGRELNWSHDYTVGDALLSGVTLGLWNADKLGGEINKAERRMKDGYNYLREAEREMNSCDCRSAFRSRESELVGKHNTIVGEWNEMKDKYNTLVEKFNNNIGDYNRMIGEHKGLLEKCDDLEGKYNRLERDNKELREKYENERKNWHLEELRLSRNEERLREEGVGLRAQLTDARHQLTEVRNERNNLLIRVEEKDTRILALNNQMADLRIEFNESNNQLQITRQELVRVQEERDERMTPESLQILLNEIEDRERKISLLKEKANELQQGLTNSQGISITEKLHNKQQWLERFIQNLDNFEQKEENIEGLIEAYKILNQAEKQGNIREFEAIEENIRLVKRNLRREGVDLQQVDGICKEIAELRYQRLELLKQKQREQQIEANIVVLPH